MPSPDGVDGATRPELLERRAHHRSRARRSLASTSSLGAKCFASRSWIASSVDAVETEALQAVLVRAQDAVVAVVEARSNGRPPAHTGSRARRCAAGRSTRPTFVASTTLSRGRARTAAPTRCSLSPSPYQGAVSTSVTPASSARRDDGLRFVWVELARRGRRCGAVPRPRRVHLERGAPERRPLGDPHSSREARRAWPAAPLRGATCRTSSATIVRPAASIARASSTLAHTMPTCLPLVRAAATMRPTASR